MYHLSVRGEGQTSNNKTGQIIIKMMELYDDDDDDDD